MSRVMLDSRMPIGGAGRYARDLIAGLAELDGTFEYKVLGSSGAGTAAFTPWGRRSVAREARRWPADLIHGLHFELPRSKLPKVVTIQDLIPVEFPDSMPSPSRRRVFRKILELSLARASCVIVPSDATASAVIRFGGRAANIRVIPLGVSDAFAPLQPGRADEVRSRVSGGRHYVAAIYHPKAHKNLGPLIAASCMWRSDLDLVLAGGGELPRQRRMHALTDVDDSALRDLYGAATLVVIPSLVEGFGLPALEALATGTPVIAGPGLASARYLAGAVQMCDVTDPASIAAAVDALSHDKDRLNAMTSDGASAVADLTIEKMATLTSQVYRELLGA
ncbi:MAG TPA: glycosyltransferase family 1 protein [Actinomycetota bacterium]|nr:glycosyltransferase family 1 protein [Actinomycetota bacterium]